MPSPEGTTFSLNVGKTASAIQRANTVAHPVVLQRFPALLGKQLQKMFTVGLRYAGKLNGFHHAMPS